MSIQNKTSFPSGCNEQNLYVDTKSTVLRIFYQNVYYIPIVKDMIRYTI